MGSLLLTQEAKKFSVCVSENKNYGCVYVNTPIDTSDFYKTFPEIGRVITWDEMGNLPYLSKFYMNSYSKEQFVEYFEKQGFEHVDLRELETIRFSMSQRQDGKVRFECSSTISFSGVPRDTPTFEGDMVIRQSYPAKWGFSVSTEYSDSVKEKMLLNGWRYCE
jgi:hypothetical protein